MTDIALPEEFKRFVADHGLFEGFTRDDAWYLALWAIEEIPEFNADIQIETRAPGFLAFAGNGAGEVFAFDAAGAVFALPMIGMAAKYATRVAGSFAEFAETFALEP